MARQKFHIRQAQALQLLGVTPNARNCPQERGYFTRNPEKYRKRHAAAKVARRQRGLEKIQRFFARAGVDVTP